MFMELNSSSMSYEFQVGDLVTLWTGGWDKWMREKYEGRAGIITRIEVDRINSYLMCHINFGWGDIKIPQSRIRLLTYKTKEININKKVDEPLKE